MGLKLGSPGAEQAEAVGLGGADWVLHWCLSLGLQLRLTHGTDLDVDIPEV